MAAQLHGHSSSRITYSSLSALYGTVRSRSSWRTTPADLIALLAPMILGRSHISVARTSSRFGIAAGGGQAVMGLSLSMKLDISSGRATSTHLQFTANDMAAAPAETTVRGHGQPMAIVQPPHALSGRCASCTSTMKVRSVRIPLVKWVGNRRREKI